ncbi:urokinase plasminogen activator surface receptor-like [Sardina pilchardus]|uniref:urokinase plasminogen activator surface receptor-like n=1 Tax=Sardina pilchardus TaxID=27697 RepID=UPI002E0F5864
MDNTSVMVAALICYNCNTDDSQDCPNVTCPESYESCASTTFAAYALSKTVSYGRACAPSPSCISGSINLGLFQYTLNTKCCQGDLCNDQIIPEFQIDDSPNGNECFTCDGGDCTKKLTCVGDEDGCITSPDWANDNITAKGCTSSDYCLSLQNSNVFEISCCQGNLCNCDMSVEDCERLSEDGTPSTDATPVEDATSVAPENNSTEAVTVPPNNTDKSGVQGVLLLLGYVLSVLCVH